VDGGAAARRVPPQALEARAERVRRHAHGLEHVDRRVRGGRRRPARAECVRRSRGGAPAARRGAHRVARPAARPLHPPRVQSSIQSRTGRAGGAGSSRGQLGRGPRGAPDVCGRHAALAAAAPRQAAGAAAARAAADRRPCALSVRATSVRSTCVEAPKRTLHVHLARPLPTSHSLSNARAVYLRSRARRRRRRTALDSR
jgi:hypothetical protein